ncbi:MAG TPA: carboxypeptidase-like regulatory domain-containing protein, partial [Vicinamibacterales bacterium]|nr:carboxypeptidase-like regulatory domain-containing protein [Vicinamibacterales bacterium]
GPIFHPGSPTLAQAGVITIAAGEERRGIDVNLMLVPTRAIEGRVLDPSGQPATQIQLFISGNGTPSPMFDAAPIMTGRSTTLGPGRFRYTNVTAGRYTVTAKRPGDPPLWAQAQVDVSGADVTGLELHLQPGLSLRGRLVFDGQTLAPPANLASVRITIAPPTGGGGGMANLTNYGLGTSMAVNADDDGFFQIGGVIPGDYVVGSFIPGNPATGWWLRSAMVNGVDAVDLPAAIDGAVNGDIVLTFSDRHSELSGTLSTPAGLPTTDYYVVVIPADPTLWRGAARRMKIARPSTAGRYVFTDVPPGEYLVSAVTDFAASDFKDRTILEQLAGAAVKVRIADGERVVQDLRIGGKDPRPGPADQVELLTLSVQRHHLALAATRSCPPCSF